MSATPISDLSGLYVVKRSGEKEQVFFDKITQRIRKLCWGLDAKYVDATVIAQKVCQGVYGGITTSQLDELAAESAAHMVTIHPEYSDLAARISVSNLHKTTHEDWIKVCDELYENVESKTNVPNPLLSKEVYTVIKDNAEILCAAIDYQRDYNYDYFGFKTLERGYLLKTNKKIAERPQHMLMRVSVGLHSNNIAAAIETYHYMSQGWFTHATPTLFNAGTARPQLSSCFLLTMKEDSIEGIYDTLKQCAQISKQAGGIGLALHKIRASGSDIGGTSGQASGLVPMLRVFNNTARYVDQGGGKRKGAFACYLEPWHADIFAFLDLRKNHGAEENRARDLFYALWISDLFMERVKADGEWTLFCPHEAPGLNTTHSEEHVALYTRYEREGRGRSTIKARALWQAIMEAQTETGTPYILYKDACNRKSNQKNLGTIQSSNLCTEIIEYTSPDEVAVCNLASISLGKFVKEDGTYDFESLYNVTKTVTNNLNRVIDINSYPVEEARNSNMRHRPVGIGVQGLADAFIMMRLPYDSPEAAVLNRDIFETIYFAALTASNEIAARDGPYQSYPGSPVSQGILQYDMWGVTPTDRWDWATLKANIAVNGVRNSLLVAPMPTATTSQILGNNECFEPYTSNLYSRRTLAGEFVCINKHLVLDLIKLGLWNTGMKNKLTAANGSVQNIAEIPADLKALYKTVWEINGKCLIDMAVDRGAFIDQSQSFNVHMVDVTLGKLTSMHFYGWEKGLKTGMYYLRTKAAADAIQFTVDQQMLKKKEGAVDEDLAQEAAMCSLMNGDDCASCGA